MKRFGCAFLSFIMIFLLVFTNANLTASASSGDPVIIVSLGDSYSSGEGIDNFYNYNMTMSQKIYDKDWLAHRSMNSWGGMLKYPLGDGTYSREMSYYHYPDARYGDYQWYFAAASGAVSKNIYEEPQEKKAHKYKSGSGLFKKYYDSKVDLPIQSSVFNDIEGEVDYVTMTMGGNDVGFTDVITECVLESTYLEDAYLHGLHLLDVKMALIWWNMDKTMASLKKAYKEIEARTSYSDGAKADIIIAGYPKLLEKTGKGFVFSRDEATTVNNNVSKFNNRIKALVQECQGEGMHIHFVDVETAFDADGGHQAYSNDPWINSIIAGKLDQDISDSGVASAYSMHPNYKGAQAYARCVNAEIERIEREKTTGTLSGKVVQASDRNTPVPSALAFIRNYNNGRPYQKRADANGNYKFTLPPDMYEMEVTAPGYIKFTAYANVIEHRDTYMETFLLVEGEEGERGIATGKITNAMTGYGVPDADIKVYYGWNNTTRDIVLGSTKTDSNGNYSLDLPLGNYTLMVSKDGFITGPTNIIVQRGTTGDQNGSISPIGTGTDFRIVLTWGVNPSDLDSHVDGRTADGSAFHVYYRNKSHRYNGVEVCNLDVDDTTSYGPETITLKADSSYPYYYYIHRYAGSGYISTSEAAINVYQGDAHIAKFNVPTDLGTGDYWNVFAIVNGQLVIRNTMTNAPDTGYAGNNLNTSLLRTSSNSLLLNSLLLDGFGKDDKYKDDVLDTEVKEEAAEITEDAEATEEAAQADENAEETGEDAEAVEAEQETEEEAQAPAEDAESEQAEDTENPVADEVTEEPAVSASEEASEAEEEASEESSTVETPAEQAEEDTEAAVNP